MNRKITITESDDKQLPKGMHWRRIGLAQHADYQVRYDKGHLETGHTSCTSLTEARRTARSIVREGRAWAEVFRYAENGVSIKPVFICSSAAEVESASTVR